MASPSLDLAMSITLRGVDDIVDDHTTMHSTDALDLDAFLFGTDPFSLDGRSYRPTD
jgi:hypothetical protein